MTAWVTQYLGILILLGGGLLNVLAGLQDSDRKRTKLLLGGIACVLAFASGMFSHQRESMYRSQLDRRDREVIELQARLLQRADDLAAANLQLVQKSDALAAANRELAAKSDDLAKRSQEIARVTRGALNSVTGGPSFCYATLGQCNADACYIVVIHSGDYPLYDVTMRPFDFDAENYLGPTYEIGELAPHHAQMTTVAVPIRNRDDIRMNVFFTARNGDFVTSLRMKLLDGQWVSSYRVLSSSTGKRILSKVDSRVPVE